MFIEELEDTSSHLSIHQLEGELRSRGFKGKRFLYGDTLKYEKGELQSILVTHYSTYDWDEVRWFLQRWMLPKKDYFHIDYLLGFSGGVSAVVDTPYEAQQLVSQLLYRLNNPTSKDAIFLHQEKLRADKLVAELVG